MAFYIQSAFFLGIYLLLHYQITDCTLRKRFALSFLLSGLILTFLLPHVAVILRMPLLPIFLFLIGLALFITRNHYRRQRRYPLHPLLRAPTSNLASHFPDDPAMQQLLQLMHDEIGLPKHKTLCLETSINFDLGCKGAQAKQFMAIVEQLFAVDLSDYDAYRYFEPPVFDVLNQYRAKSRGEKIPLAIGMLYLAIKTHRWDTQTLENLYLPVSGSSN